MSDCICPLTGFCNVRQILLQPTLQTICRTNKSRIDRFILNRARGAEVVVPTGDIGTAIRDAIETATGVQVKCASCLQYLRSLNSAETLDCDEIAAQLAAILPLPECGELAVRSQQAWQSQLQEIVETTLTPRLPEVNPV